MNERLSEVNERIDICKKQIKKFLRYKNHWWNPLTYFVFSKDQCNYFITSYKNMLRFNIIIKRAIINRRVNGDI